MPAKRQRNAPLGSYSNAPKNLRNFATGSNIIPQGIITDPQQNVNNVEHIIKYLSSNAFRRMIDDQVKGYLASNPSGGEGEVVENPFDPSGIWQNINNLWNTINNWQNPEIPEIEIPPFPPLGLLTLSVNGTQTGVSGNPYDPLGPDNNFNINLFDIIPENPFYPMKVQNFVADIPNGYNQYDGQAELQSDTQVILVKKENQNAIGIRFYNMNAALSNERVMFVHMSSDSTYTDNVQILFSTGTQGGSTGVNMNARLQEANLVFISRDFCMFQPIGSGGSMN